MRRNLILGLAAMLGPLGADTVVIQNAKVIPVAKPAFTGSIVIKDGKISDAGEKILVPQGARVVDAGGSYVIPGIIDAHSHIAADAINEGSVSVSSMVNIRDVINPESIAIYRALAGGVTAANILHGSANAIGGQTVVLKMRWGKDAQGLLFEGAKPGIKFALGENVKRQGNPTGGGRGGAPTQQARYPATRMGTEDVIREAFTEAKEYQAEWERYNARTKRGETIIPPRRDLKLEPLVEILEGKRLVHAHCYRADEILMLIRVADEFGFKIRTFQHVLEGYKVAKEIAEHGAGASTFSDWWAYKVEAYDAIPFNAAIMTRKGVVVSLNSDDAELMRRLNTEAAKAMKYGGLNETEALSLVTLNPAKQLGVENRVGSIEPGKDADLVMYDKHPLSVYAKVQKVFIDGNEYFDREKDIAGRTLKEAEKKKLLEKQRQIQSEMKKQGGPTNRRPQ